MSFITIVILSFLPALVYSGLIYISVPYKIINLKKSLYYLICGFMSVGILLVIYETFPWIETMGQKLFNPILNTLAYLHFKFFISIALLEELSKLLAFLILEKNSNRKNKIKAHPIATMFYVSMVSLGFAILENIKYGMNSYEPGYVIALRSVTAVVGHLVFGLFMGYWISFGRLKTRLKNRSILDIHLSKDPLLKTRVFTIIGLLSATILHGIYDLHIAINDAGALTTLYMLLLVSILGAVWCIRNLFRLKIKETKLLK